MDWTTDRALTFAPNPAAAKRAQGLATLRKWSAYCGNERAIWGSCAGSRGREYHVCVDFRGPAFKCSCVSKQFPCKHGLALLLLYINSPDLLKVTEPPEYVSEWLEKRDARIKKKAERTPEEIQKSEADKAKRLAARLELMQRGMVDLEQWLEDLIRQGLASFEGREYSFWNEMASRMVDAKAPVLGRMIKEIPLLISGKEEWAESVLSILGEMYLLVRGFKNYDNLPEEQQLTLRNIAGVIIKKEELQPLEGLRDDWIVLGQKEGIHEEERRIYFRRTWFQGKESQRMATLTEFAQGGPNFLGHYMTGTRFNGEVVYYPSTVPMRCIMKNQMSVSEHSEAINAHPDCESFLSTYAKALSANPWVLQFPCCIKNVIPVTKNNNIFIVDKNKKALPLHQSEQEGWKLLAISGGQPITIFGEWTGKMLVPLSAELNDQLVTLQTTSA